MISLVILTACAYNGYGGVTSSAPDNGQAEDDGSKEAGPEQPSADTEMDIPEGYHLVWNDEFDGDTLNEAACPAIDADGKGQQIRILV